MLERFRGSDLPTVTNLFDSFLGNVPSYLKEEMRASVPRINVSETDDKFKIEVAAPGLKKEDLNVDLDENVLTISSEKEETREEKKENGNNSRKEFSYTSFKRAFSLPETADSEKIDAHYQDGILNIIIPKKGERKNKASKNIKVN